MKLILLLVAFGCLLASVLAQCADITSCRTCTESPLCMWCESGSPQCIAFSANGGGCPASDLAIYPPNCTIVGGGGGSTPTPPATTFDSCTFNFNQSCSACLQANGCQFCGSRCQTSSRECASDAITSAGDCTDELAPRGTIRILEPTAGASWRIGRQVRVRFRVTNAKAGSLISAFLIGTRKSSSSSSTTTGDTTDGNTDGNTDGSTDGNTDNNTNDTGSDSGDSDQNETTKRKARQTDDTGAQSGNLLTYFYVYQQLSASDVESDQPYNWIIWVPKVTNAQARNYDWSFQIHSEQATNDFADDNAVARVAVRLTAASSSEEAPAEAEEPTPAASEAPIPQESARK